MKKLFLALSLCLSATFAGNADTTPTVPDFKEGDIYYIVTDAVTHTVKVTNDGFIDGDAYPGTSYTIPATVSHDGVTYTVTAIGEYAFANCSTIVNVTLPQTIKTISEAAFYNCTSLTTVPLPDALSVIGSSAFYYCTSLYTINIPATVTEIGDHAFGLSSLTSFTIPENITVLTPHVLEATKISEINIPASVTSISDYAFYECSELQTITIAGDNITFGESAFRDCTSLTGINIPAVSNWTHFQFADFQANPLSNNYGGVSLYANNELVTEVTYPDGDTSVYPFAFCYYNKLQSVTLPASVTQVGEMAFYNCSGLKTLNLYGPKFYAKRCFFNNTGLTTVNVADIAEWCASTFENSWSIPTRYSKHISLNGIVVTDLVVPEGVTALPDRAFRDVILNTISLPSTLQTIGIDALSSCSGMTSITCNAVTPPANGSFLEDVYQNAELLVPAESIDAYRADELWKNFVTIKANPQSGVSTIDMEAGPVSVYDLNGRLILSGDAADVNTLPRGIYIVKSAGKTRKVVR